MIEILVAVGLMSLVMLGLVSFFRQAMKMYYVDGARLAVNADLRSFTVRMEKDADSSNFFLVYPGFGNLTTGSGSSTVDAAVANGQVGDFLVLVYIDPAQAGTGASMITRLVGYYREVTNTNLNTGPVHRFDVTISPSVAATSAPMYSIINTYVTGSASSYPVLDPISQGLTTNASQSTPTPALFYNLMNRSVMISTQMSELLTTQGSQIQTGNTYNFTVSPRG